MSKSNPPKAGSKPGKPYAGFPLFAHPSGQWAKKIRKRLLYFGSWRTDPEGTAALETFHRDWPYLKEGRTPPAVDVSDGCTLKALCNDFLRAKEDKLNAGDLSARTFRDYYKTCQGLIDHFGKDRRVDDLRPDDFRSYRAKLAKRFGVVSLKNEINRCCILFNYAHENNLIDKPVSYGQGFDRPSAKALRRERNAAGPKLFEREEVLRLLGAADKQLKAMILLGINCGFGNTHVASLPQAALDLQRGWATFSRPKTEIQRRCPLWPETIAALREAIASRSLATDPDGEGLCFLTRCGQPWVRVQPPKRKKPEGTEKEAGPEVSVPIDSVSHEFGKLLRKLKINGRRGVGFYTLRHNFETYAGESRDQVAVDSIMGHVDSSMAGQSRERISDERLKAVTETVRRWLFPSSPEEKKEGGAQ